MITLHQFYISPFCDKIRRQLHWKGIDYQVEEYPLMSGKAIRKIYPAGKLPCLEHDGKFIGDSTDIAYYIEESFPEKPLLPEDPAQRGMIHVLDDWADESLYMYEMFLRFTFRHNADFNLPRMLHADKPLVQKFMPRLIRKGVFGILKSQGLARKTEAHVLRDIGRHIDALSKMLSAGDWLVGDSLTLADISVYSMICCIHDSREGQKIIGEHSRVLNWMQRVEDATGGKVDGYMPLNY